MKILYVLDFFHPHVGGVPTFFKNLTEQVSKMGHEVTVVTTHADGTRDKERYGGVKVYRFGKTREQFLIKATLFLARTREKFDVIHTSTYSAMIPSYLFSIFKKVPEVLSVHEVWTLKEWTEFAKAKGLFYFMEERLLFSLPYGMYVSPSLHTQKDLEGIGVKHSEIKVIPHGIDRKIFNPKLKKLRKSLRARFSLGQEEVVGCFVGKAAVFKGIDYLLDALEDVMGKVDLRFVFVLSRLHESGYRKFLGRIERSETLRKNVILAESTSDHQLVSKIIAGSDFLAMPSLTEGFGFVAAEAASIGIPVIATKGTSLEEVLEDGKNAIFIRPRSSKDLARAISRLAKSKKLRQKLSRGNDFKAWEEVAREYVKVYQDVMRKNKEAVG